MTKPPSDDSAQAQVVPPASGADPLSDREIDAQAQSLERLYDYTKFHIGVYLTLTASYITITSVKVGEVGGVRYEFLPVQPHLMGLAIVSFLLAGLAGGVIVSSITQHIGGSSNDFLETQIGPWNGKVLQFAGRTWTYIEHNAFWVGLLAAIGSVFVPRFVPACG